MQLEYQMLKTRKLSYSRRFLASIESLIKKLDQGPLNLPPDQDFFQ